jgi:multidrug resistance efflux pump
VIAAPSGYCRMGLVGKKRLWIGASAVLVICAGGVAFFLQRHQSPALQQQASSRPAPVEVVLPATIRAQAVIPVGVPLEGTLESVEVDAGQQVYEGQLLARINNASLDEDQRTATADLASAQARLDDLESQIIRARATASQARAEEARSQAEAERAERNYLRQQMLHREGATPRLVYEKSQKVYEEAGKRRDSASALARSAEERLTTLAADIDVQKHAVDAKNQVLEQAKEAAAAAEIHSPVDGFVVGRNGQIGDAVTPSVQDLFRIAVNLSALEAVIRADQRSLKRLRVGQEAVVAPAGVPDAIVGHVTAVNSADAVVRFTSPTPAVRPGMTAQVRVKVS